MTVKIPTCRLTRVDQEHFIELLLAASARIPCPSSLDLEHPDIVDQFTECVWKDTDMSPAVKQQLECLRGLLSKEQFRELLC